MLEKPARARIECRVGPTAYTRPMRSRARPRALIPLLLGALAASCGGGESAPAPPGASLFDGLLEAPAAVRAPVELESVPIVDASHGWSLDGVGRTEVRTIWGGTRRFSTETVVGLGFLPDGEPRLERALEGPATGVNRVEADVSFWGPGSAGLRAVLLDGDGVELGRSAPVEIQIGRGPVSYALDLPRGHGGRAARLRLEFDRLRGPAALVATRLLDVDARGLLPTPGAPAPVAVGTSCRHAAGLWPGEPLRTEVTVPEDARLHLAVTGPETLDAADSLTVALEADGVPGMERTLPVTDGAWLDEHLDIAAFGGRRTRITLTAQGGVAVVGGGRMVARRAAPTVVLMSSDTHRADHLGSTAKGFRLRTPQLDRLAARGAQFLNCTSTANITNPSHMAMLTGVHPRDSGVVDNTTPLSGRAWTLAEAFQRAGYRTLGVTSALHLQPRFSGLSQGFDLYDAPVTGGRRGDPTIDVLEGWLDAFEGEPLFVFVHIFEAHAPYLPDGQSVGRHVDTAPAAPGPRGAPELPPWARDYAEEARSRRAARFPDDPERWLPAHLYRAEVEDVDRLVGRVREIDRLRDGLFAFVSDHGESFGARGVWWDHASLAPDNLGVPLLVAGPGVEPARLELPVQNHWIGATLLELAGVERDAFPGGNLLARREERPRFALSAAGEAASVALGPWQLTMALKTCPVSGRAEGQVQGEVTLVDLREAEPRPDRLDEEFERARRLRAALVLWLEDAAEERLAGPPAVLSEAARESLAALGYGGAPVARDGAWWDPEGADPAWLERFR